MSAGLDLPEKGDYFFDGGNLDCGSGLALLIRQQMSTIPAGGVLEMRSSEPSVELDLPPWCRLVGHDLLGSRREGQATSYFIRKGSNETAQRDQEKLVEDKQKARDYEWRLRTRSSEPLKSTVYCRNFSFAVGQPASFEERDRNPSAVEYLLGALSGALCTAFATACSRQGLKVDDIEISVQGGIDNVLAHLGLEDGDPSLSHIKVTCYASTFDSPESVREVWDQVVRRCPLTQTLLKNTTVSTRLNIV